MYLGIIRCLLDANEGMKHHSSKIHAKEKVPGLIKLRSVACECFLYSLNYSLIFWALRMLIVEKTIPNDHLD